MATRLLLNVICSLLILGCHAPEWHAVRTVKGNHSIVRVTATGQAYDFHRPWLKRQPVTHRAVAPILSGNRILVTAEVIADATYIEIEKAESGAKTPATVEWVDYEANLALLKSEDTGFFSDLTSLSLAAPAATNDEIDIWQLESNDTLAATKGYINTVEVGRYTDDTTRLLLYRLNLSLQIREGGSVLPALNHGRLAGLLFRYDARTQNATVIPSEVIERFLKETESGQTASFPQTGFSYSTLRDPQLRRYAGAENESGGVYLTRIGPESPAARAGLESGDVLLAVDGTPVDMDGHYQCPPYGKVGLENWVASRYSVGDKLKVKILRKGKPMEFVLELNRKKPEEFACPPYLYDRAPGYYVLGGLVFLELSRPYLREWGENWATTAPQKLVYEDAYQDELFGAEKRRLVILSQVLSAPSNIGYDRLHTLIVTKINGKEIRRLSDIDPALEQSGPEFCTVEFEEDPRIIYLDIPRLRLEEPQLQKLYRLNELKRIP